MIDWIKKKLFLVKWGRVARKWPVERLMATTDLDLTADETAEMKWGIHSWRQLIPWYLARFDTLKDKRQFYCFGVAHGSTVEGLVMGLQNRGTEIPFMHLSTRSKACRRKTRVSRFRRCGMPVPSLRRCPS